MPFKFWAIPATGNNTTVAPPEQNGSVPLVFLQHLIELEPHARFEFFPPDLIKSSNGVTYHARTSTIPKPIKLHIAEAGLIRILDNAASKLTPQVLASGYTTQYDRTLGFETSRRYFLYKPEMFRPLSSAAAVLLAHLLAHRVHSYGGPDGFGVYDPTDRGRREDDRYPLWKDYYNALFLRALSRLTPPKYPDLYDKGMKIKK
jgi:hypothetical protein